MKNELWLWSIVFWIRTNVNIIYYIIYHFKNIKINMFSFIIDTNIVLIKKIIII